MSILVGTASSIRRAVPSAVPGSAPTTSGTPGRRIKSWTAPFPHAVSAGVFAVAFSGSRSKALVPCKQMRATSNDVPEASKERWGPFYHYTNKEGADGINKSGTLRSTEMIDYIDAAGGEGIYVTDMDPWNHSKADILTNNYGKETEDNEDKADYYVKFYVTKERWNVKKVRDHVFVITDERKRKGNESDRFRYSGLPQTCLRKTEEMLKTSTIREAPYSELADVLKVVCAAGEVRLVVTVFRHM